MRSTPELVCVGRIAVDLYGEQDHTPLEETRSFARYLGGSSGNTAIASARAGARTAIVSAVGDDPMGRYLLRVLEDEAVDARAVAMHKDRRTALAFLGMLDSEATGIDFYRQQPADAQLDERVIPSGYFEGAKFVTFTGTHIADPDAFANLAPIVGRVRQSGAKIILDIDLRGALWSGFEGGLKGSVERVVAFAKECDVLVGNEDEIEVIGLARADWAQELHIIRKLGANGAAWDYAGETLAVPGMNVDVVNPVGAGDAFLGNLLAYWIRSGDRAGALRSGNAAGALVATRHGCSVEMPYREELDRFLDHRDPGCTKLAHIHRSLSRKKLKFPILALACDHRVPFNELMTKHGRSHADAELFKRLVLEAMKLGFGDVDDASPAMLADPQFGQSALNELGNEDIWTGRPVEVTGSRPLKVETGHGLASDIGKWRPGQVAKVLVWFSPDDPQALIAEQLDTLHRLQAACRQNHTEWILELVPPLDMPRDDETLKRGVETCYRSGLFPDWWKLPALSSQSGWSALAREIRVHDSMCRGVLVLGLSEAIQSLSNKLELAAQQDICAGFAIGRSIFANAAERWFCRAINDRQAVAEMAERYNQLVQIFVTARRDRCAA